MESLENLELYPFDIQIGIQDLYILTLKSMLAIDSGNHETWYFLGDYMKQLGWLREAEQAFLESLELYPQQEFAWFQLAMVYEHLGKREDAEIAWKAWRDVRIEHDLMVTSIQKISDEAIGVA